MTSHDRFLGREERHLTVIPPVDDAAVTRDRALIDRLWNIDITRKVTILLALGLIWELGVLSSNVSDQVMPTASATLAAFGEGLASGAIQTAAWNSIKTLLSGYGIGLAVSSVFVSIAVAWRFGTDMLTTLSAMLNPLPAIALLPLAMIWFGLGKGAIIFTLLHSIVWPVSLYAMTGIRGISPTLKMMGRNYGLRGPRFILLILLPAAFPTIISGLRIAWAFAWRTLMAAELVFGGQVSGGGFAGAEAGNSGGLGWYIFRSQMENQTASVFAGLLAIIVIGIFVENVLLRGVERLTVERWGMTRSGS